MQKPHCSPQLNILQETAIFIKFLFNLTNNLTKRHQLYGGGCETGQQQKYHQNHQK